MKTTCLALLIILVVSMTSKLHAQLIDTISDWNQSSALGSFGNPETQSYGEILDTPNAALNSFSFELKLPSNLQFQGYVGTWNGTGVGQVLYASPITTTVDNNTSFDKITFNTGSLNVGTGSPIILFASVYAYSLGSTSTQQTPNFVGAGNTGDGVWGWDYPYLTSSGISGQPYGTEVWLNSSDLTGTTSGNSGGFAGWAVGYDNGSPLAFQAQFSAEAAPEPSTWALMVGGLGLLAFWHNRTRHVRS